MTIRPFQPGDDTAQVSIYNEAAGDLPRFKPATIDEVRRRCVARDFDPNTRLYALENGRPVGYATFHDNGRVSYPWCRKGHERWAGPLFERVLEAMRARGLRSAFAAYRADWAPPRDFFLAHGFEPKREMLNYALDRLDMPTPAARPNTSFSPVTGDDLPDVLAMAPEVFRVGLPALEKALLRNPYFSADSLFALRGRDGKPAAVAILVANAAYANPKLLDAMMPCFRLGAFGTEGMTTKRINGLFSFVVAEPKNVSRLGLDLLGQAAYRLQETRVETVTAQVSSDVPHLVRFYQEDFRAQGSFPLYERTL